MNHAAVTGCRVSDLKSFFVVIAKEILCLGTSMRMNREIKVIGKNIGFLLLGWFMDYSKVLW